MNISNKTVSLYLDDASIRLLVTGGKQVKKWAEMPVEPGLIEGNVIVKEAEVAAKIKKLLKSQGIRARKAVVGISGLHCLTRPAVLPLLPPNMITEAVAREAKRVLPMPLDQLYLSWQVLPAVKDKMRVFIVAVPRKTADALMRVLQQAGISASVVEIKPMALIRIARQSTSIVVDMQPSEFDIVVLVDGVPQPIRTVPFPKENLTKEQRLALIRDDLDKTVKFYNANNPDKPLKENTPVYACGELADQPELCQFLSQDVWFPVLPLLAPMKCPEELDQSRYLVNISLAVRENDIAPQPGISVVSVNSLPEPYRPKPISLFRIVVIPAAVVCIGLLVPLVMQVQGASANIDSMQNKLDKTSQVLKTRLAERTNLTDNVTRLDKDLAKVRASLATLTTSANLIPNGSVASGDLDMAVNNLTTGISLTSLNHNATVLNVMGNAATEWAVIDYANQLQSYGRFYQVTVASIVRNVDKENPEAEPTFDFTLHLKLKK